MKEIIMQTLDSSNAVSVCWLEGMTVRTGQASPLAKSAKGDIERGDEMFVPELGRVARLGHDVHPLADRLALSQGLSALWRS